MHKFLSFDKNQIKKICQEIDYKGYSILGKIITDEFLELLNKRTYDLMMGNVKYEGMFFKLDDPDGNYFNIKHQDVQNEVFQGPSERYKKIKDLEYDPFFLELAQCDIFKEICNERIGNNVSSMRAMILNKSRFNSSILPFHQDVSENWAMSDKPNFTVWVSLNGATKKNGCLKVIEGSHKHGVIGDGNNLLDKDLQNRHLDDSKIKYLELEKGEACIFTNYTLHGSDKNETNINRLGYTICFMDSSIYHKKTKKTYPVIFGDNALTQDYIKNLKSIPKKVYELV